MTLPAKQNCSPCRKGAPPLSPAEIAEGLTTLPGWQLRAHQGVPCLEQDYPVSNFSAAMAFANQLGAIANQQDHHPVIQIESKQVTVRRFTWAISGLHQNDLIMAAKTDLIFQSQIQAQG